MWEPELSGLDCLNSLTLSTVQTDKEATLSLAMHDKCSSEIYLGLSGGVVKDEWGMIIGLERDFSEPDGDSDDEDDDPTAEDTVYDVPPPSGDDALNKIHMIRE